LERLNRRGATASAGVELRDHRITTAPEVRWMHLTQPEKTRSRTSISPTTAARGMRRSLIWETVRLIVRINAA
jgi:hypothetical protein